MNSIRSRLTIFLSLGLAGLFAVGGLVAFRAARSAALREFDFALKARVTDLAELARQEHGLRQLSRLPEFSRVEHPEFYQVILNNHEEVFRSPSLGSKALPMPSNGSKQVYEVALPNGLPGRAMAIQMSSSEEHEEHAEHRRSEGLRDLLVLARDTTRLSRAVFVSGMGFLSGGLCLIVLAATTINIVIKSGLRPLNALADQASAIQPQTLDTRFSVAALPAELTPITERMNETLDRIEDAFERERYLTAAMAHELYTPIAELRSMSEVALEWPDDKEATRSLAEEAYAVARRMQSAVDALLSLSRCEAGLQQIEMSRVDITESLDLIGHSLSGQLADKGIQIAWEKKSGAVTETDPAMLAVILNNLLKNAAEYTPQQGSITCRVILKAGYCGVVLTNSCQGITTEDLPHLTDPFWRKDKARSGSAHSGLGLTVAFRFCELLGARLLLALPEKKRFEATVWIPSINTQRKIHNSN